MNSSRNTICPMRPVHLYYISETKNGFLSINVYKVWFRCTALIVQELVVISSSFPGFPFKTFHSSIYPVGDRGPLLKNKKKKRQQNLPHIGSTLHPFPPPPFPDTSDSRLMTNTLLLEEHHVFDNSHSVGQHLMANWNAFPPLNLMVQTPSTRVWMQITPTLFYRIQLQPQELNSAYIQRE